MSRVGKSLVLIALLGLGACDSGDSAINPVANAGPDQTVGSNATVTLDGSGSTGSGTLTYSWSQTADTTVTLSSASASRPTFTAPAVTADEVLTFQLTVTDANNLTSTDTVSITVVDGIPTADAGPDQTVVEGAAVTLDGSGSVQTNGGTIVSYAWAQTGGPAAVNLAGTDTTSPSFDAPSVAMDEVLTFELTVTDDNGDSDTDTVAITVGNDTPPVAEAGPGQSVDEGTNPVTLDGSGSSDAVGTIAAYSWAQTAGTAVVLTGGNTASPTFTAPQVGPGGETLTFELTVTDDAAQSDTDTVDIVVDNVNLAPQADAGPDQIVAESSTVNLDGTRSSDPDGPIAAFAWTQTSGPTVTLNDTTTATPDFAAPLVAAQTTLTFELTVTDDLGAQDTDTVDIVIDTFNLPPIANAGPDQAVTGLTPVNLDGTGSSDPDGGVSAYAWTQTAGPGVTLINGDTATPSFTAPSVTMAETLTFRLAVTDNDPLNPKRSADTVDITVEPPNAPPTADAGPDQSVTERSAVSLDGTGSTDTDGTIASYAWTQTAGASVTLTNADTAAPAFTAPGVDAAGETLTFELTVIDDDGDANTDPVDIVVNNDPALTTPPTAVAGADQVVSAGDIVTLNGTFSSDGDGTITAYDWNQTGGTTIPLSNANTAVATFTAPATPETLTFELQVTDNDAATGTDTLTVRINAPPSAGAGVDQVVVESSTVTLDGTASSDSDGSVAAYQWTQTGGAVVILTNATTSIATFTAPPGPASLTFELTVTDNDASTSTDTIEVRVNAAPTANAGPDQSVDEQSAVSLDASASSDADGTITGFAWTQTGGTAVALTGANTGTPSFTAPAVSAAGETLTFQVQVTDDDGATDTDTVDVQVDNDPALSDPPTALAGPDQVASAGATVTLDGSASIDTDGTITAYQWTQISGAPVALTNANTAVATFTAPAAPATLAFELEVTDNDSSTGTDMIEVRVNAAPTASAGPDQSVDELSAVNLTAAGSSDVDGSIAGYAWTQTAGTTVTLTGAGTAAPSITAPSVDAAGETLTFEVEVTDNDGATDTDTVDIQVNNDPALTTPPIAVAGADQVVSAGHIVTLNGTFSSDSDGTITAYQWTQVGGTTVTLTNADAAVAMFTAPAAPDSLTFELVVTDNDAATGTGSTTVRVNAPPIANAGPDQSVNEQAAVNLTASGSSDVDGSIAAYSWTQTDGTAVVLTNADTATPEFTAPLVSLAGESLTFEVEVTDDVGATDTDTVDVQVSNDPAFNIPPTAVAGPDQTVGEGVSVTLDGSGSTDDTLITDYQWTQTDGTAVTLTNADQAISNFTSPAGTGTLTFELEVTDEEGGTATDQIEITVSGTVTVSGKVTYDHVPHAGLGLGGLDYASTVARPARLVTVQAIDATDDTTVIATDTTDSAGDYSFALDPGLDVFLRVRAEMIDTAGAPSWDFTVVDNTNGDALYVLDTVDINTGAADQTVNINAATTFDGNDYTERNGAVFAILDTVHDAFQTILATDPTVDFMPLKVYWSINNTTVSGDIAAGEIGTSFYRGGNPIDGLYLLGDEDIDTEEYDRHVIAHEFGHYVEDTLARSDSIGGAHTLSDRLDKRVAFGEGFANAWASIVTGDTVYIDTLSTNQAFAGGFDVEDGTIYNGPNPAPGWYNERSVQEVIYDLYDSTNEGAPTDSLSLGFGPIYSVLTNQQVSTPAFASIFSFIDALKDDRPGDAAAIDAMTGIAAIDIDPVADEFGTGETNDAGVADSLPVYKTLTIDGPAVNVCSNDSFDPLGYGNKLNTIQFVRLTIPAAGFHTFSATATVVPAGETTDPDMWLRRPPSSGIFEWFESQDANSESGVSQNFLPAGDYILEVFDFNNRGSRKLVSSIFGGPPIGRACFDVTVTSP